MEKNNELKYQDPKCNLSLQNRKNLTLSGVIEVMNFDSEKISLNTKLGSLIIKGENLKMNKLDVENGDVIIVGEIYYMVYSEKEMKKEKENIIARLFK